MTGSKGTRAGIRVTQAYTVAAVSAFFDRRVVVVVVFFFQYNQSWTSLPSIVLSWNSVSCIKCLILWRLLCYETGPFTAPCTSVSVTVVCD